MAMIAAERKLEEALVSKLRDLKYEYRPDIRDRSTLEQNFREKFEALNRVRLTDTEFTRLIDEIVTPDVFSAARTLRERNSFIRDDGTPLNYTLVNIRDWCKNAFEVVNQLRINTDNSHHRYDVILLINGVPVVQIELKTLGISPRRAMEQIVDYKNDPGNGYTKTLLCFLQIFIVSNRDRTYYFANNNARHFAFNAEERFLPVYEFADVNNKKITHLDSFAETFLVKCTLGQPPHLWSSIANMARTQSDELLKTLQEGFKYIENESFQSAFLGLFSEINLYSEKLGKTQADKNKKLCSIIAEIAKGLAEFSADIDALGDAYEYLIGQFAAGSGKKAGEFYTPQQISDILSAIVTLDSQEPKTGKKNRLTSVLDFACGSGSLLLNVRKRMGPHGIGKIYGQEKNITTYNLARMNMLLHGVKDTEFEIYHGDTLTNDWDILRELNPAKKPTFDAVVANPPFSYRWEPTDAMGDDVRFKNYGLAPKSAADFAFLLHGFHFLKDEGVMAIILPHGVLFRGGAEERIRTKLLKDGHIDTVIGLPANLFYSTGIPVCILVLKRCKKPDDVLFINAAEHFAKGKRQNQLNDEHIAKIVSTYQYRTEEDRYSKRIGMERIAKEGYNLNISRYISTSEQQVEIDLSATHRELVELEKQIQNSTAKHNVFLKELGLSPLPVPEE